jgi:hypothetical protein
MYHAAMMPTRINKDFILISFRQIRTSIYINHDVCATTLMLRKSPDLTGRRETRPLTGKSSFVQRVLQKKNALHLQGVTDPRSVLNYAFAAVTGTQLLPLGMIC